jgi:hypothetical protein
MILNFNPFEEQESCQIAIQLGDKIVQQIELPLFLLNNNLGN